MKKSNRRSFLSSLAGTTVGLGFLSFLYKADIYAGNLNNKSKHPEGTGYVYDPRYLEHHHSVEKSARLDAINKRLIDTGIAQDIVSLTPVANPLPYIKMIHSQEHIDGISSMDTTGAVAALAVGGALAAVDAVCKGEIRNAFCGIRPPGHHAASVMQQTGMEEGFCFYNNIAIAARYAQTMYKNKIKKVLIIDWDYHHGNGTEETFYSDDSVLFFSTHKLHAYPGTGDPSRIGEGKGEGYTVNVPLDSGAGDDTFVKAWDEKLIPVVENFKPDLVLVSAGFDSKYNDYLGDFQVTECGFGRLTKKAMEIADNYCDGRLVSCLEGGYADRDSVYSGNVTFNGIAKAVEAHVGTLLHSTIPSSCPVPALLQSRQRVPVEPKAHIKNSILCIPQGKMLSRIDIFDMNGRRIHSKTIRQSMLNHIHMDDFALKSGLYIIKTIYSGNSSDDIRYSIVL